MRNVEVCPYDENWISLFTTESKNLKNIYKNEIVEIHHIGSTSVPGLQAKPIIDIMPIVKDINVVEKFNEEMKSIGYEPKGEYGIPGRRYFQKGGDNRTHHVHIYEAGSNEIIRHLAFRDYLRIHPDIKKSYGEIKQKLALEFPYDKESYINGKDHFVKEIEKKALELFGRTKKVLYPRRSSELRESKASSGL